MDTRIMRAAALLRPGTAWNLDGVTLTQAIDGTPRVSVPTPEEISAVLAQVP